MNATHFKGVNSGLFLEVDPSNSNRHQQFGQVVLSTSGNAYITEIRTQNLRTWSQNFLMWSPTSWPLKKLLKGSSTRNKHRSDGLLQNHLESTRAICVCKVLSSKMMVFIILTLTTILESDYTV